MTTLKNCVVFLFRFGFRISDFEFRIGVFMLIFDSHLDLAWNALEWNRDLHLPLAEIRQQEHGLTEKSRGCNTVCFPELRRGKVAVFLATLLARLVRPQAQPPIQRFTSMTAAYAAAHGQLAYYRVLEQQGVIRCIRDWPSLDAHVKAWLGNEDGNEPFGYILSMEGADPVLAPEQIEEWWQAGLRVLGPAHYGVSPYAHGTSTLGGLFPPGKPLLKEMERVGMVLDITHLSDQSFDEALDNYGGPLLASHHNCRALVPDQRVIGAALDAWMLYPGWVRDLTTPEQAGVTLETVVDHLDHVCQLAGNARHAAIGSDLDGGFGREQGPQDLDSIADLQRIPELLRKRGYGGEAVEGIMYGNWVRFFREVWSMRDEGEG
jgi:membrane dipeptidase